MPLSLATQTTIIAMEHKWYECHGRCGEMPGFYTCPYCDGGLASCIVCGASEGTLTSECPGRKTTDAEQLQVMDGHLDFINGIWKREPLDEEEAG